MDPSLSFWIRKKILLERGGGGEGKETATRARFPSPPRDEYGHGFWGKRGGWGQLRGGGGREGGKERYIDYFSKKIGEGAILD